ncbi:phosphate/phosphite/phosphonate ABC transporter substrate-binding protein [Geovibrio thiophilus]|uniref:Phosphate/phosphite/phosphonate ABC transporter substrate-binding protein n=1 Tax=Geovibrio thiophilus TaxID=139438 RepID=A0A3R5UYL2_9BACT|nr:PhnD/SsuA/transferrin family substrate-binding protein [Geovibrio thiophilus]QAR32976.1 phosphate/phosphite/phosphonate ABC transporter substrate-binding protein [Geovibrio thiophilus]
MKYLIIMLSLFICSTAFADKTSIVFGIVPLYSASETLEIWGSFAVYAENADTGIIIRTERSTQDFESGLFSAKYDIAFMTASQYEKVRKRYRAIAVPFEKNLSGAVITHVNSGINSLKDLDNKHIAFASPDEHASSVVMQKILSDHGISFKPVYLNSVTSVVIGTKKQLYPAGSVLGGFYENDESLKTVFVTDEYESYVIGVSERIGEETAEYLRKIFTDMHRHSETKAAMKKLGISLFIIPEDK